MLLMAAGGDLAQALGAFGTDWLYVLVPLAGLIAVLAGLATRAPAGASPRPLVRASQGAAAVFGLPTWCAGPMVLLIAALIVAVQGFLWDVAWHIDIGRDEFLFSPPHMCLLIGLGLLGVAGLVAASMATRERADVGWRVDRWQVPYGAAILLVASAGAMVGFSVDELWHWAYGLDVTMWSPPHLTMISAAAFSPMAGWILLAEAGPRAGNRLVRPVLLGVLCGAVLIGLSAWQLEYDLGVSQWQQLYHPVLVAAAGGFGLTAGRAALGRGGALITVATFIAIRGALAVLTAGVWGLSIPRFVPYLAAGLVVEGVFALTAKWTPLRRHLAVGAGVGTLGLAGAWVATQLWAWNAWAPALLPRIWVAVIVAVAAAVLGGAFGRVVSARASGIRAGTTALAVGVLLLALAIPLPRTVPAATATVTTSPAGDGMVLLDVQVDPVDAVADADRFEAMAWQGGGHHHVPLVRVEQGHYRTPRPLPAGGEWKTYVRLGQGSDVAAVPVSLPEDAEIGAGAVPLVEQRTTPFQADRDVMLREAKDGPTWPGIVGYGYVGGMVAVLLGLLVAATVALERRRRGRGWRTGEGTLAGRRILLTGASGGIGASAREALEAAGAHVVGLDLHGDAGTIAVDLTAAAAVTEAVEQAARRLGGIDTVICNAGIGVAHPSLVAPGDRLRRVLDVNLYGSWNVIAAAAEHLRDASGHVVVVGSGLAVATVPYSGAYTASKRALTGYADVLRIETAGELTVSTVQPAYIRTPIHHDSHAQGATLEGLVRCEDVRDAAAAIVTACETGRRELGSSPITTAQLWLARRAPALTDRVLRQRWQRLQRTRPQPTFATRDADLTAADAGAVAEAADRKEVTLR